MVERGFSPVPGGVRLELDEAERSVLADLLRQMSALLGPIVESEDALSAALDFSRPEPRPEDPALLRLFPDAYRDDPDESDEFRRYTQESVRQRKVANVALALGGLTDDVADLPEQSAAAWLGALNDLRLTLGTRLEVTQEDSGRWDSRDPADSRDIGLGLYDWLTWLQSSLIESLSAC
ncbi:MAG: DUF2017 domain-containing protein [Candidatus Nanopelagicales bacterium]|nr:DUF2017 domain-containing protein [Candidatus Nanopelagicales bacterium]MDZ4249084.1 DUF2017 domain-containing protein [Candidatus Nanopelagicales bacterium]